MKSNILRILLCLIFKFLIVLDIQSQPFYYNFFNEIPIVTNTDSLEKKIKNETKKDILYLNNLICLERSRDISNSHFFGNYIDEIDSLRVNYSSLFLKSFVNYLILRKHTITRTGDYKKSFESVDISIEIFKNNNDSSGLVNAFCQKAFLEMFLQQSISNNNLNRGNYNLHNINSSKNLMSNAQKYISDDYDKLVFISTWQKIFFESPHSYLINFCHC